MARRCDSSLAAMETRERQLPPAELRPRTVGSSFEGYASVATRALVGVTIATSFWYAGRSLALAVELLNPWPYYDQWIFIQEDFFRYLDGSYRWLDLFAAHNEHRIVTSRLVLFADAVFFHMGGLLPILVTYGALAVLAAGTATLAAPTRRMAVVAFLAGLGLFWSTVQWETLGSAFQTPMALVHLFALAALASITRPGARWIAVCLAADFLAVFTLGSGVFLIAPLVLAMLWTRRPIIHFVWLIGGHIAVSAAYLNGVRTAAPIYGFSPIRSAAFVSEFLGLTVGVENAAFAVPVGAIGVLVLVALTVMLTVKARKRPADPGAAVLVCLAIFVAIEACAVAYTRFGHGISWRYATQAVVFWTCILGAGWRILGRPFALPLLATTLALTVVANRTLYERLWRYHTNVMVNVGREIAAGDLSPQSLARIFPSPPGYLSGAIRRLQSLKLGPFFVSF
jgi:hydrogenase-4 membrane subunit HyfE